MADQRRKDNNWAVAEADGTVPSWERVGIAVLMDIRDEMKKLNALLHCPNFTAIPHKLDRISNNTTKTRAKK